MSDAAKNFDLLAINFNVLYNYFDNSIKLFSDLYLVEFLDNLAKSFFPCSTHCKVTFFYVFIFNPRTDSLWILQNCESRCLHSF